MNFLRIQLYIALIGLFVFSSCSDDKEDFDDIASADYKWVGLTSASGAASNEIEIPEGNGAVFNSTTVTLSTGGVLENNSNIQVDIEFSGAAVFGEDFMIASSPNVSNVSTSGMTVTIPADTLVTSFQVQTITNIEQQPNRSVSFEIVSNSLGYSIGYPRKEMVAVGIIDDDCDFVLADDFTGPSETFENSVGLFGEFCCYDAQVSLINSTTLLIGNVFDFGWEVIAVLDPADNSLTISPQGPYAGLSCGDPITDWQVSGTGALSPCTTSISLDLNVVSATACGPGFGFQLLMDIDFTE